MKTCPICNTTLFDDMETCYGCMYTFGSKPELEAKAHKPSAPEAAETKVIEPVPVGAAAASAAPAAVQPAAPHSAASAAKPGPAAAVPGESMPLALLAKAATLPGWGIRFEMRDEACPAQTWTMELTPPRAVA